MSVLTDARVGAALPCSDFEATKAWYKEKMGLAPSQENPGGAYYDCGAGSQFFLFPSMGKASGDHTQVGFQVDDIKAEVADLKSRGVTFEEYDYPDLKTVDSIGNIGPSQGAWFKDPEGNMLAIFQNA